MGQASPRVSRAVPETVTVTAFRQHAEPGARCALALMLDMFIVTFMYNYTHSRAGRGVLHPFLQTSQMCTSKQLSTVSLLSVQSPK